MTRNSTLILVCIILAYSYVAQSQCTNAPYGQYPSSSFTPNCNGVQQTITTCGYRGEYSLINVTIGNTYRFYSSIGSDFNTIATTGNTPIIWGFGTQIWTATFSGQVRFYNHTNSSCGSASGCMTRYVVCTSGPSPISCSSVSGIPSSSSFENTLNGWTQSSTDNFDWSIRSGGTPSSNTGPSGASSGSYYLYIEGSSPRVSGEIAEITRCFDFSSCATPSISFDYHMYGASIGTLSIEVGLVGSTTYTTVFSISGQQGNQWNSRTIDLSSFGGNTVSIKIKAVRGSNWDCDIAIDNIFLECVASPPANVTTVVSSDDNVCSASTSTIDLTASGADGTVYWFAGSCGSSTSASNIVGTGAVLSISPPSATTTYYAKNYKNGLFSSSCRSVTVQITPTPNISNINGPSSVCQNQSASLNVNGSGTIYNWYSDAGLTNLQGTGASFNSPALSTNTTYYVQAVNSTNNTYDETINKTVLSPTNTFSFTPASSSAVGNATLVVSAYGDIDGSGSNLEQWSIYDENNALIGTVGGSGNFADQCNAVVTTSITLSANQINTMAANGTITFSAQDLNGNINTTLCGGDFVSMQLIYSYPFTCPSSVVTKSINVNLNSTSPTITKAPGSECPNTTFNLTASGGVEGTNSVIKWYSQPNGAGTFLGTGSNVSLSCNTTTTYYARREGLCNTTNDAQLTVVTKSFVSTAPSTTKVTNDYCTDNSGVHHFYDGDDIMLSIQGDLSGMPIGYPLITVDNAASYFETPLGVVNPSYCSMGMNSGDMQFEMSRCWNVDDGGGVLNGTYDVTIYYNPSEKTDIINAANNWISAYPDCGYQFKYPYTDGYYWFKNSGSNYVAPQYDGLQFGDASGVLPNGVAYNTMNGLSSFSGGSAAIQLVASASLPITLLDFSGVKEDGSHILSWQTSSEENSDHFLVMHSTDGISFEPIGQVSAKGYSNQLQQYNFNYNTPSPMANYYKLKMVDTDGSYEFSKIIVIQEEKDQIFSFYPNPVTDRIVYQYVNSTESDINIRLFDVLGKTLLENTRTLEPGNNKIEISVIDLPEGTYFMSVLHSDGTMRQNTFIKIE